jgi:hypothetical protein
MKQSKTILPQQKNNSQKADSIVNGCHRSMAGNYMTMPLLFVFREFTNIVFQNNEATYACSSKFKDLLIKDVMTPINLKGASGIYNLRQKRLVNILVNSVIYFLLLPTNFRTLQSTGNSLRKLQSK